MSIYALLVGINKYQGKKSSKPSNLAGCLNDIKLFKETLQSCYDVPDVNINVLTNENATKNNIVAAFQNDLPSLNKDDTFIFYFSGHGSQELAAPEFKTIEADSYLETLVCHDSRAEGGSDLADKELRYLISQATQSGAHTVVISDSCHSGGVSRAIGRSRNNGVMFRQTASRHKPRPWNEFIFYDEAKKIGLESYIKNFPMGKHILFFGCRDREQSQEQKIVEVEKKHGVFTYSLCKTLQQLPHSLSYNNLHGRVKQQTHHYNKRQTPQIESSSDADLSILFLATEKQPVELRAYYDKDDEDWYLDAGIIHGVSMEDEISLFDQAESNIKTPLLLTEVIAIEPDRSVLSPLDQAAVSSQYETFSELDKATIYSCVVTHSYVDKLHYIVTGDNDGLELIRAASESRLSSLIEENNKEPRFKVTAKGGKYYIQDAHELDWRPLFKPCGDEDIYTQDAANKALSYLEYAKRFQQKLELSNPSPEYLNDSVDIVISYKDKSYINEDLTLTYDYTKDSDKNQRPRIGISIQLHPNYKDKNPIYCGLFILDKATLEIHSYFNNEETLQYPDITERVCEFGTRRKKITTSMVVKDELFERGITEVTDVVKLLHIPSS